MESEHTGGGNLPFARLLCQAQSLAFMPQIVPVTPPIVSLFTKGKQGLAKVVRPCQQVARDLMTATQCCMA